MARVNPDFGEWVKNGKSQATSVEPDTSPETGPDNGPDQDLPDQDPSPETVKAFSFTRGDWADSPLGFDDVFGDDPDMVVDEAPEVGADPERFGPVGMPVINEGGRDDLTKIYETAMEKAAAASGLSADHALAPGPSPSEPKITWTYTPDKTGSEHIPFKVETTRGTALAVLPDVRVSAVSMRWSPRTDSAFDCIVRTDPFSHLVMTVDKFVNDPGPFTPSDVLWLSIESLTDVLKSLILVGSPKSIHKSSLSALAVDIQDWTYRFLDATGAQPTLIHIKAGSLEALKRLIGVGGLGKTRASVKAVPGMSTPPPLIMGSMMKHILGSTAIDAKTFTHTMTPDASGPITLTSASDIATKFKTDYTDPRKQVIVRLDADRKEALTRLAKHQDISVNQLLTNLIDSALNFRQGEVDLSDLNLEDESRFTWMVDLDVNLIPAEQRKAVLAQMSASAEAIFSALGATNISTAGEPWVTPSGDSAWTQAPITPTSTDLDVWSKRFPVTSETIASETFKASGMKVWSAMTFVPTAFDVDAAAGSEPDFGGRPPEIDVDRPSRSDYGRSRSVSRMSRLTQVLVGRIND